jgi:flagellar M-ring protein FliF
MNLAALLARWNALGRTSRVIALALFACIVLVLAIVMFASHPASSALFAAPLRSDQLEEVEERLAAWNVPFTPTQDNVVVAPQRRNELLLRLSLAGVPHAHLAGENEALASVGALTPQSVIDEQTLEGRENDIAVALRGVDGVQDARVLIAPQKTGEFADQSSSDATASVWLQLAPGSQLSRETISGIRNFVAAAVPALSPSRVTILDDRGASLDNPEGSSAAGTALQAALQSALDTAFGAGATIVRVREEFMQQSIQSHDVAQSPASGPSIQSTASARTYRRGNEQYHERSLQTMRATQTHETTRTVAAGTLARVSTAVFVDAAHAGDLLAIRDVAAATVGYDPQRGDTLAVQAVDFARSPPARKDPWWLLYGTIVPLLPTLVIVLGVLVAFRLVLPSVRQAFSAAIERARIADAAREAPAMPPARVHKLLASEPPHAAAAIISALPAATAAAVLELYPPYEREAIIRRMHRTPPPLFPDPNEFLRDA